MPGEEEITRCIERLRKEAEPRGYHLNPNGEDLRVVIEGYLVNEEKFGYPACPCRLATGNKDEDLDIICPCDYRDDDVNEHGACYCSLYVDEAIAKGEKEPMPVPERRGMKPRAPVPEKTPTGAIETLPLEQAGRFSVTTNVWRCPVCGYLAAKDQPPPKCPICGVDRDRFELFIKAG